MIPHGISWTTFGALYGVLAAAVIALFLLRLTRRGRAVSSTLIWEKVMGRVRSLWQELASLVIQLLLFLLVCLALVDPRPPAETIQRRWVAFIFDGSESMAARDGDATRLRQAERQAWQAIDRLSAVDRAMILSAGPTVEALTPFTGNREELKRALAGLEAYGTRPKFAEAIAFALASFDYAGVGANDAKELIALSDRPDQVVWPDAPGVERRAVAVGATAANLAITAFAVRQTMNLSSAYDALVEVANFGPSPARSELLVFTPEHSLGSQALALAPGERFSKVIGLPFGANGKLTALLRNTTFADGSHDALPTDDAAFAFLPPQRKARTLLVTAKNVFLYNALALDPEVELSAVKPGEYQPGLAAGADVAFFDGFAPPQPPPCNAVYFAPKGGPFTVKEVKQKPTATGWADGHPLLQHVTMDALTIESAEVFKPQPQDIALMGHYDGALMLLRQEGGRFLLGIGFDLAKTDFPLQAAFPILMHNIVHIFAGRSEGETPTGHQVGEKVDLALSAPRAQVTVQDPLDKKLAIPARAGRASMRPRIPGFYTYADGDALRVFAASLTDADESNLTGAPGEAMPAFPEIKENPTAEVWWPYFVLAALILAAADLALFFYGRLA